MIKIKCECGAKLEVNYTLSSFTTKQEDLSDIGKFAGEQQDATIKAERDICERFLLAHAGCTKK